MRFWIGQPGQFSSQSSPVGPHEPGHVASPPQQLLSWPHSSTIHGCPGAAHPMNSAMCPLAPSPGIWNASHGCIRMLVEDVVKLYDEVPVGTPIFIN